MQATSTSSAAVDEEVDGHRVRGVLADGEDAGALVAALLEARPRVLAGELTLLLHSDAEAPGDATRRAREAQSKLAALERGRLKRYVFSLPTRAGPRIVKIAETVGAGNTLAGLLGSSVGRREHANHARAEALGLAVTRSVGFLEQRRGALLVRACQIQTPLAPAALMLTPFLAAELEAHGDAALDPLAEALAATHAARFFHADLKGFHAYVVDLRRDALGPARYALRWLDLGRVSFHLTRRKRIINLYQALRFVVPRRAEAEERFIHRYCRASGWCAADPERALRVVRRFLTYKLRTHPLP